jgi:glucokinase
MEKIMPDKSLYIGTDIGGTHMRTALIDSDGNILGQQRVLTEIARGAEQTTSRLVNQCGELIEMATKFQGYVKSLGLGVAGKVDHLAGRVIFSPNLPEMNGYPLAVELEQRLQVPVFIENDANLFGIGERWLGAGRDIDHWVGVTLGTGVGGCLFLDGRLWNGDNLGYVGEIGHTIVDPHGPQCVCGLQGCLEAHSSGRALIEGVQSALFTKQLSSGQLYDLCTAGKLTPKRIYQAAREGNAVALRLFERMGWALGLSIANLFTFFGIRHAIIGGGVSASWDLFIAPMQKSLAEHSCMLDAGRMVILKGLLGDNAALLGAARLAQTGLAAAGS